MKLNPNNPEDRAFLQRTKNKTTGRSLLEEQIEFETQQVIRKENESDQTKPKSKYGNKKVFRDNVWFDSIWEYECWISLKELQARKLIFKLDRQKEFSFDHNGIHIGLYRADFIFDIKRGDQVEHIVADAKHRATAKHSRWPWIKKMMKAFHDKSVVTFYKCETNVESEVCKIIECGIS